MVMITAARVSTTRMAAARMTTAGTSATGPGPAGAHYYPATRAAAVPAVPALAATPAKAAAPSITAPIETRTVPAVLIPTIASSAEDKLRLLNIGCDGRRREPINWHRA